jgi:hypothetical protein
VFLVDVSLWGKLFIIFQVAEYEKELEEMKHMTRQEFVASLRRYKLMITL